MKRGALIVNVARGGIVDEAALIEAFRAGRIAGAALDVADPEPLPPDSPLWDLENVIISPHISAAGSRLGYARLREIFAAELGRFQAGRPLAHVYRGGGRP